MSGPDAAGDPATAGAALALQLAALDARSWAQLLRSLRRANLPATAGDLLARPSSDLVAGPPRRDLCAHVAADAATLAALRADLTLPATVHALLGTDDTAAADPPAAGAAAQPAAAAADDGDGDGGGEERAARRARDLRRSRDEERRRREGAEARAAAAEARAEEARAAADRDRAALADRDAALARAEEATADAVARAERRAAGRLSTLEDELAAERRTVEELRRTVERLRADVAALRADRDRAPAPPTTAPAATPAGSATRRPLHPPAELDPDSTAAARWLADRCDRLVVDGYNVVLTLRPGRPLEEQRRWLVERLRPLAARGPARPLVVFDGAGRTGGLRDTGGVEVRFTAGGASADDEIVFEVAATDRPMLVVTDDVELRARVQAEGGNVVGIVHLPGIADG